MDTTHITSERKRRVAAIAETGSLTAAVHAGLLPQFMDITSNEALVLGLLNQGIRKYIGIFGHGSTDLAEILRIYQPAGLETYAVHHEVLAAHAATTLYWQYGETAAVFTSIGPGAMQALAGSLASLSNGAGVYYLFGDETTHDEGYNMQQIPRREQGLFLKLTSVMGPSYSLHTPEAMSTALRRGLHATRNPCGASPFYLLLPMNTQPALIKQCNLLGFPCPTTTTTTRCANDLLFQESIDAIRKARKPVIKIGGGSRNCTNELLTLAEQLDAVIVSGPQVPGVIPFDHPRNMTIGGSKGSISGNYAMHEADLAIVVGARAVCQWDSSGVAWKNVQQFINFNTHTEDAAHYNRTIPIVGDARINLQHLIKQLKTAEFDRSAEAPTSWFSDCREKRQAWDDYRQIRYDNPTLYDEVFQKEVLTQPAAIKRVVDFAESIQAVKYFDAGDVQANGFQVVEDQIPNMTFTETGASYMGFAVSSLIASAMADHACYGIALTGEGSFLMNPQILVDAVEHNVKGMIVIFDNRRMGAISGLQWAQYGEDYGTRDSVVVDYLQLCSSVKGVQVHSGGTSPESLTKALEKGHQHEGLSVVHVPVYCGQDENGSLGAWGQWNVGNWCATVQKEHQELGI